MDESAAQRQRLGAVILAAMLLGAVALAWPRRAREGAAPAAPGPATAGAMVPREARGVLRFDVAAMRRAPAFARWFDAVRSGGDPCASALGERVTGLLVVWSGTALEDFTLLADGPVDEATFRRCAGVRRGRALEVTARVEAGVRVLALAALAEDGGRGGAAAETWRLPAGVLALGDPAALRAMLAEARAHPDATAVTPDLAGLWAEVPAGVQAAGVRRLSPDPAADPALAHALAVSAWLRAEGDAAVLEATVRCDGAAGAAAVAAGLSAARGALPDLTARADDDRVRLRATLDPAVLQGLLAPP
jgi:hypothetical protein